MKTKRLLMMMAIAVMMAGCHSASKNKVAEAGQDAREEATGPVAEQMTVSDGRLQYGQHDYRFDDGLTLDGDQPAADAAQQVATLTFTHFPASIAEFEALQQHLLGRSMAGSLALNLLAYEMYRRDRETGEQCIRLCNTETNASSSLRTLKEKFSTKRYDADDRDTYHQPYLVASFLDGATQQSKYQPTKPYTMRFHWSVNPNVKQHERSDMLYGYIYHLYAERNVGNRCDASVLVPDEGDMILVNNCPNFYFAVPNIQRWEDCLE